MKTVKFTLHGETAFFKKPDVNTYYYFTYGNVHKVALLGMFGAILGLNGYQQMKKGDIYPEFYDKLKDVKIAIIPQVKSGNFPKKIQSFNNSVGYASKEMGGNLIVKEQWLENPKWDIYFLVNDDITEMLADFILNQKCIYHLYLGKNDHFASIDNPHIFDAKKLEAQPQRIDSLIPKSNIALEINDEDDEECEEDLFKYEESLPTSLDVDTNLYELTSFLYTNMKMKGVKEDVYKVEAENIVFF